jgi:DNA repair protein RadC
VFKAAILANAAAVILVHNHPSGNSRPSATDRKLTEELMKAADIMTIPLLDHVLIGLRDRFSFADHGLIEEYRRRLNRSAASG